MMVEATADPTTDSAEATAVTTGGQKQAFKEGDLNDVQRRDYQYVTLRINQLQQTRKNHYGTDLDKLYAEADRDYVPHRIKGKTKRVITTDEDKGWRSQMVDLGAVDWQTDISQANPLIKIQTALSILIDQNPGSVFTPLAKKFQATNDIMKQLYSRSWEVAKSINQLKLFVFNLAKYGWAVGRTYPLRIERKVKVLVKYNHENPEQSEYEEKTVVEYDDVFRENLDVRNVWIDDATRPSNGFSVNDWAWRKVYDLDKFKDEFGKYPRAAMVEPGGNTQEVISKKEKGGTKEQDTNTKKLVEVLFYENKAKDLYMVIANKVPIIIDPLPIATPRGIKKLSLWQGYWNLRHAESPYGIGIYEAIRFDQSALDRVRNMTLDQLVLSIYKMFFYQGTATLTETGEIKIKPGVGKQVLDPKNIKWLEVPGPGQDAYMGIEMFRKDVDEASGITDPLLGQVTGKTAFEIAQAKESALKRLKNPLDNITEALNEEAAITVCLIQLLYSIPEVYKITDQGLIDDYLREVGADPALYEREAMQDEGGEPMTDDMGNPQTVFNAKVYREFPLNLDKDEQGNLVETPETQFFRIKPGALDWEGVITVKSQSLLSPSKQVEKALEIEMYNMLIPLMQQLAQERQMFAQVGGQPPPLDELTNGKTAKAIVKLYDKDPRDILPDSWLQPPQPTVPEAMAGGMGLDSLFVNANEIQSGPPVAAPSAPQAEKLVSSTQPPQNPQSPAGKIANRVTQPFRV